MQQTSSLHPILRRLVIVLVTLSALPLLSTTRAEAQLVAVIVNGDPITNFDVEQRSKLIEISTHKSPPRPQVIDELIDEKLKLQLLRRYAIPDVDKDADNAFTNMARRMRQSPKEFTEQLAKSGLKAETLKSRLKADIVWSQIIRGRYQSSFQFNDKDIQARLDAKKPEDANVEGYDYTLRPILFVVPRGSPPAAYEARMKEAEAFRARFQGCDEGIALARNQRFVAVRGQVVKGSADLAPALRDILAKTELGRLTPPETTREGIETYALCSKTQSENAPAKKEMRDQLFNETFNTLGKQFLKELRSQAMIERR
jgi:peptidyl-prolyl cis-trans isomerase SurA